MLGFAMKIKCIQNLFIIIRSTLDTLFLENGRKIVSRVTRSSLYFLHKINLNVNLQTVF